MKVTDYIRIVLTVALLIVVWFNAHWSVALAISMLTAGLELQAFLIRRAALTN